MAKKVYKIEAFHGGVNKKNDPRDIKPEELEEAFNVDISNPGRITMPGDGLSQYFTTNPYNKNPDGSAMGLNIQGDDRIILHNEANLTNGYGLFTFSHDYNMNGLGVSDNPSTPQEIESEFICINDGAHIDIWDVGHSINNQPGQPTWLNSAIKLGKVHFSSTIGSDFQKKVKPIYYKADNGLRVCDGNFNEKDTNIDTVDAPFTSTDTYLVTTTGINNWFSLNELLPTNPEYLRINSEIMRVTSTNTAAVNVKRAQFGTVAQQHANGSDIYILNLPKVLSHIKRPMLEKANTSGATINIWKEDIQCLEPPNDYSTYGLTVFDGKVTAMATSGTTGDEALLHYHSPDTPEKVLFSLHESTSADDGVVDCNKYETGTVLNGVSTIKITASSSTLNFPALGFTIGKFLFIKDSGTPGIDGLAEIVGIGTTNNIIIVSGEYPIGEDSDGETTGESFSLQLEDDRIAEDLQNKYIFGMSYLYDGGGSEMQESPIRTGYLHSGKIEHRASVARTYTGWYRSTNLEDFTDLLDDASGSSWNIENGDLFFDDSDAGAVKDLAYRGASDLGAGNYFIAIDVTMGADASLTIYPPGKDGASASSGGTIGDGTDDGTSVVINESGTYLFKAKAEDTSAELDRYFVCRASNPNGDGDISIHNVQVFAVTPTIMSATNAIDMRGWESVPKMFSSFNMNMHSNYKWNERIAGYKIYMKQVDSASGTLSSEWLLALKVDFKTGEYTNYTNDNVEQTLKLGDSWDIDDDSSDATVTSSFIASLVTTIKNDSNTTGISSMDTMRNIPLDTYQSENSYSAETNTAAMYKTATMVNRKIFIGNLKIGNKTYPDRMIEAPIDRFDTFPDDGLHYIDIAVGDGDEIVKLESIGDKLIQFKKSNAYLIQVSSEGVELIDTWPHMGIKSPTQAIKAAQGVIWVNDNGMYYYDGKEVKNITGDKFNSDTWKINEDVELPALLLYDETSNKIIVQTTNVSAKDNGGFIYDVNTNSLVECQNLFQWYETSMDGIDSDDNDNPDMGQPMLPSEDGVIIPVNTFRSNSVTARNKKTIVATNTSNIPNLVEFHTWNDTPKYLWQWTGAATNFNIQTKDIDFGNPSRRKKIYKVYVTFKAGGYMSGVIAKYATNGSNSFTGTFNDTTYYSASKGFDSWNGSQANSTDDWITVALKPTTTLSATSIYSIQLKFEFANAGRYGYPVADTSDTTVNTITLDSGANTNADYYNGMPLFIYSGTGYGPDYRVIDYNTSDVATVDLVKDGLQDTNDLLLAGGVVSGSSYYDVGHIPKQFEINDISIVHREKPIK